MPLQSFGAALEWIAMVGVSRKAKWRVGVVPRWRRELQSFNNTQTAKDDPANARRGNKRAKARSQSWIYYVWASLKGANLEVHFCATLEGIDESKCLIGNDWTMSTVQKKAI